MVGELLEELSSFSGREEGLRGIGRYSLYDTVFYRSSDFSHSKRVAWLVGSIEPLLREKMKEGFDLKRALALALVHDDAELITGDYQAATKSKMNAVELAALKDEEMRAIHSLAMRFPKTIGGHVYEELLQDIVELSTPEAQVAKFLDRFDAQGEALHEMYGGNTCIIKRVTNEYGVMPLPFEFYRDALPKMLQSYEHMCTLGGAHPFFRVVEERDWDELVPKRQPHTRESLSQKTGHAQYDGWVEVVLDSGDAEEIANLHTQKEFLP